MSSLEWTYGGVPGEPQPPRRLGRYELLSELGRGAMGAVYRARDAEAGRDVALKLLLPESGPGQVRRLEREGVATARLRHPGIVGIHDAGEVDGVAYLAYELVEGARTLADVLPAATREERLGLLRDVARAVGHAHAAGVCHRDLKPSNVLVDAGGAPRVADFGLARLEDGTRLTESNAAVGTPLYMSPEQVGGLHEQVGAATDVWALGVMLYQAACDQLPFDGASMVELAMQITSAAPRPLRDHDPTIPRALERLVKRALGRTPSERFPDGEALARALDGYLAGEGFGEDRPRWLVPLVAAALATTLLGVGAVGVALSRRDPTPTPSAAPDATDPGALLAAGQLEAAEAALGDLSPLEGEAWRVRLELARGRPEAASAALARAEQAGLEGAATALLEARLLVERGGDPLPGLWTAAARAAEAEADPVGLRALLAAEAEAWLRAGHAPEALDVLDELERAPAAAPLEPAAARWCEPRRLRAALEGVLAAPPQASGCAGAPVAWSRGAARWLLDEGEALRAWTAWLEDPRTRAVPEGRTGPDREDLRARARACFGAAEALGGPEELRQARLLGLCLLAPAARDAGMVELGEGPIPLGAPRGRALLALAEGALARADPAEALALLGRVADSLGAPPEDLDVGQGLLLERERCGWLLGRAQLARGDAARARAALERASALCGDDHLGIVTDLLKASEAAGDRGAAAKLRARLRLLEGAHEREAFDLLIDFRRRRREGGPTLDDVQRVLELAPTLPFGRYYLGRAQFNIGERWRGLRGCLRGLRRYPPAGTDLQRLLYKARFVEPGQIFLRAGLYEQTERDVPAQAVEGQAYVLGLRVEMDGLQGRAALAPRLAALRAALACSPEAWELRTLRALVLLRCGLLRAAARDVELCRRMVPTAGSVSFVEALLLAARGRPVKEVVDALERARQGDFKLWADKTWEIRRYPELRDYLELAPFQDFLAKLR
ncbi:MAG: protein kinase [Planctomycetota bacterium]